MQYNAGEKATLLQKCSRTANIVCIHTQMCNKMMSWSTPEWNTSQRDGYSHNINSAVFLYPYANITDKLIH